MPDRGPWTISIGLATDDVQSAQLEEHIILVPDGGSLVEGFSLARAEAGPGRTVRLIARGSTVRRHWPSWVEHATGLLLTELDAYLPRDREALLAPLRRDGERWLIDNLRGVLDRVPVERAFWASFANRLLLSAFVAWPLAVGVAFHHPGSTVRCAFGEWPGCSALRDLLAESGGELLVAPLSRLPGWRWRLKVVAWAGAALLVAAATRLKEYVRESPSRAWLKKSRRDQREDPAVWIGVLGDWPHASRQMMAVAAAAKERGQRVGVILQDSLRPGHRDQPRRGGEARLLLPTLDEQPLRDVTSAVDQCASAESFPELARTLLRFLVRGARTVLRVARAGPVLDLGPVTVRLDRTLPALAKLLSIDILRAYEAERAAISLTRRHNLSGRKIVWPHASHANLSAPDLIMQLAGATTYELVHGAFADRVAVMTYAASTPSVRLAWSEAEARFLASVTAPQHCLGGFVPAGDSPDTSPRKGIPLRLLALTNYGHGIGTQLHGRPQLDMYETAFFEALSAALSASQSEVALLWRPHPDDDRSQIDRTLRTFAHLNISLSYKSRPLLEDLAWSNVLITSWSTSIVQALANPLPIFVHDIPVYESTGVLSSFHPLRRFSTPDELRQRLPPCLEAVLRGAQDLVAPEDHLRG